MKADKQKCLEAATKIISLIGEMDLNPYEQVIVAEGLADAMKKSLVLFAILGEEGIEALEKAYLDMVIEEAEKALEEEE